MSEAQEDIDVKHRSLRLGRGEGSSSAATFNGERLSELLRARCPKKYAVDRRKFLIAEGGSCRDTAKRTDADSENGKQDHQHSLDKVSLYPLPTTFRATYSPRCLRAQGHGSRYLSPNPCEQRTGQGNVEPALGIVDTYHHLSGLSLEKRADYSSCEKSCHRNCDLNQVSTFLNSENDNTDCSSVLEDSWRVDNDCCSSLDSSGAYEQRNHSVYDERPSATGMKQSEATVPNPRDPQASSTYLNELNYLVLLCDQKQLSAANVECVVDDKEYQSDQKILERKLAFNVEKLSNLCASQEDLCYESKFGDVAVDDEFVGKVVSRRVLHRHRRASFPKPLRVAIVITYFFLSVFYLITRWEKVVSVDLVWLGNCLYQLLCWVNRLSGEVFSKVHLFVWEASRRSNNFIAASVMVHSQKLAWMNGSTFAGIPKFVYWISIQNIFSLKCLQRAAAVSPHPECKNHGTMRLHQMQTPCFPYSFVSTFTNSTSMRDVNCVEACCNEDGLGIEHRPISASPSWKEKGAALKREASITENERGRSNNIFQSNLVVTCNVEDDETFNISAEMFSQTTMIPRRNGTIAFLVPSSLPIQRNTFLSSHMCEDVVVQKPIKESTQMANMEMTWRPVPSAERSNKKSKKNFSWMECFQGNNLSRPTQPTLILSPDAEWPRLNKERGASSDIKPKIMGSGTFDKDSRSIVSSGPLQNSLSKREEEAPRRRNDVSAKGVTTLSHEMPFYNVQSFAKQLSAHSGKVIQVHRSWWHNVKIGLALHHHQLGGENIIDFLMALN